MKKEETKKNIFTKFVEWFFEQHVDDEIDTIDTELRMDSVIEEEKRKIVMAYLFWVIVLVAFIFMFPLIRQAA